MGIFTARQHDDTTTSGAAATLAKTLAPEEVRPGEFVAVLSEIVEVPSFYWGCDAGILPRDEAVRIRYIPCGDAKPLKVESVCLPFVLVKPPRGKRRTLDLRKHRLARLDPAYGAVAWEAYRKKRSQPEPSSE